MRGRRSLGSEVTDLRGLVATLALETKLIRLERFLARKDWFDQPRSPAGLPLGLRRRWGRRARPCDDRVDRHYPTANRIIVIEVRPRP